MGNDSLYGQTPAEIESPTATPVATDKAKRTRRDLYQSIFESEGKALTDSIDISSLRHKEHGRAVFTQ
jgi:hypothetical protein